MAQFTLPANSKIGIGRTIPGPPGATRVRAVKVYRWNPDDGKNPVIGVPAVDLDRAHPCGARRPRDGPADTDLRVRRQRELGHPWFSIDPRLGREGLHLVRQGEEM